MPQRLSQVIAVEKQVKGTAHSDLTTLHRVTQTPGLWAGMSRSYRARQDGDVVLPGETQVVQVRSDEVFDGLRKTLTKLFDVVATKDKGNTEAKADVVVDGVAILSDVPVETLLFLEKQLVDVHTFLAKLPILDPAEEWNWDEASATYRTPIVETTRTQKVPRNHVKAEATDKHPAQVEVYNEDVVVGFWDTRKFSGALPATRVRELVERVSKLQEAVKYARAEANTETAEQVEIGDKVFDYLLAE